MLHEILSKFKIKPTSSNMVFKRGQHVASNSVGWCWTNMLASFEQAFTIMFVKGRQNNDDIALSMYRLISNQISTSQQRWVNMWFSGSYEMRHTQFLLLCPFEKQCLKHFCVINLAGKWSQWWKQLGFRQPWYVCWRVCFSPFDTNDPIVYSAVMFFLSVLIYLVLYLC